MTRIVPCALFAVLLTTSGCAAVVAGAAGVSAVKYASNGSQRAYAADVETTWTATLDSMREAGYPVDANATYASMGGAISIGDAKVRVQSGRDGMSHVLVRVGTFDNQRNREAARRILDGVQARVAPEPTPGS
jgi:uncharacterized protein YceK